MVLILSLPFCQPLQIPGLSLPFGLVIALCGFRMLTRSEKIWLPKKFLHKKISQEKLNSILDKAYWLIKRIKPWIYPRLQFLTLNPIMKKANGCIIIFQGLILALPLPLPLSNMIAAWALLFMALGILKDDGLCIIIGYLISLLVISLSLFAIFSLFNL